MGLHVFVVMPYGKKKDGNEKTIDFDSIYKRLIGPALKRTGFEVFRADEEFTAGDIRSDMFQELLLADLVVADISIDNPNAWYELGVRHALRSRGIIHISCRSGKTPFDVTVDRKLRYSIDDKGEPAKETLKQDKAALATMAGATVESWHGRKISPVYRLLDSLQEPEWKKLRVGDARQYWEEYEEWARRIRVATKKRRVGDVLVLASEPPTQHLRLEAYSAASQSLRELNQFNFASEQVERALELDPGHVESKRKKAILLARMGKLPDALQWAQGLAEDNPHSANCFATLGAVRTDVWEGMWQVQSIGSGDRAGNGLKHAAAEHAAPLREAIDAYVEGFTVDPTHYYSGIKALNLLSLDYHLTNREEAKQQLDKIRGGVEWAVHAELAKEDVCCRKFWARATKANLALLYDEPDAVAAGYEHAVAAGEQSLFNLGSCREELYRMLELGFREDQARAAIKVLDEELKRVQPEHAPPGKVVLFSGHMVDRAGRPEERFPAGMVGEVEKRIREQLEALDVGMNDLAMCGGACGSDLLFAKAAQDRGLRMEIRIPFDIARFIEASVRFAGDEWTKRFYEAIERDNTTLFQMPEELGPGNPRKSPFARNNLWQLYTALSHGPDRVNFVSLWNGRKGDGPGGTSHMQGEVRKRAGKVWIIDSNEILEDYRRSGGRAAATTRKAPRKRTSRKRPSKSRKR